MRCSVVAGSVKLTRSSRYPLPPFSSTLSSCSSSVVSTSARRLHSMPSLAQVRSWRSIEDTHSADLSGLILQHITYAFPAVLLMMRKRSPKWLPESRTFKMPSVLGWAANVTTAVFAIIVLIFYDFPTVIPVTGASMSELFQTQTPVAVTDFDRLCIRGHWCDDVVHNRKLVWPCMQTFPWTTLANIAGVIICNRLVFVVFLGGVSKDNVTS
jgi:hypothetical protein